MNKRVSKNKLSGLYGRSAEKQSISFKSDLQFDVQILPNEIIFKNPLNYRNNNSVSNLKESPLVVKRVATYETSSSSEIQSIELLDVESSFSTDSDVICGENCSRSFSRNGDPTDSDVICSRIVDPSQIDVIDPVLTTDIQVCAPY